METQLEIVNTLHFFELFQFFGAKKVSQSVDDFLVSLHGNKAHMVLNLLTLNVCSLKFVQFLWQDCRITKHVHDYLYLHVCMYVYACVGLLLGQSPSRFFVLVVATAKKSRSPVRHYNRRRKSIWCFEKKPKQKSPPPIRFNLPLLLTIRHNTISPSYSSTASRQSAQTQRPN